MMKSNILYVVFFISIIAMIVSLIKIIKNKNLKISMKTVFVYLTIFVPFLGLFLAYKVKE